MKRVIDGVDFTRTAAALEEYAGAAVRHSHGTGPEPDAEPVVDAFLADTSSYNRGHDQDRAEVRRALSGGGWMWELAADLGVESVFDRRGAEAVRS